MSHISKCPKVTDVLSYWEASGEVSEQSYKSFLYFSFIGSYCSISSEDELFDFPQIMYVFDF